MYILRPLCVQLVIDTTALDDPPQAKISMQYLGVHNSERRSIEYSTFSRPTRSGNDAKYKDFS